MSDVKSYDTAYPGSMVFRKEGSYLERTDHTSLANALLEAIKERDRRIEDLEAAVQSTALYAYEKGWRTAANWVNRDDLIADISSPAYEADLQHNLKGVIKP